MKNKLNEILEALLLSASRPINIDEMVKVFDDPKPSKDDIRSALNQLDEDCIERGIELKQVASGYQLMWLNYGKNVHRNFLKLLWKPFH